MTTKVGFFPQNNTLWVARHRDLLPAVEWVDLNALGRGERVDPTRALPSAHGDHLFDGGYDFIGTGSTPPVTAQAKGHDIVYVAISEPRVENGRLVVRDDSPIASVAELKGKRVALGHGSWQTTLLLLALEREGLGWGDIVPVDAYGNAAELLVNGDVDAWVGSYPYLTPVESRTRTLVETDGLFSHRSLWFTRRDFARERPEELAGIVAALQRADHWTQENPREAAALFDGDLDAWEHALRTRPWGLHPVSEEFVAEQQHAADLFHANGLIQRKITVADAVLPEIGELVARTR
ncbi:ABC transporter substrate-binding protein [Nonomuraea wenchangensis]